MSYECHNNYKFHAQCVNISFSFVNIFPDKVVKEIKNLEVEDEI